MKKLEATFVSGEGGFSSDPLTYTQIARTDTTAIYERSRRGLVKDYEVFSIKILPKGTRVFNTITDDDEEKYPSTSQFGFSAFSFGGKMAALKCYDELNKKQVAKESGSDEVVELTIPTGEFTIGDIAKANSTTYVHAFNFVKESQANGSVKFLREERRHAKGKASKIFAQA